MKRKEVKALAKREKPLYDRLSRVVAEIYLDCVGEREMSELSDLLDYFVRMPLRQPELEEMQEEQRQVKAFANGARRLAGLARMEVGERIAGLADKSAEREEAVHAMFVEMVQLREEAVAFFAARLH